MVDRDSLARGASGRRIAAWVVRHCHRVATYVISTLLLTLFHRFPGKSAPVTGLMLGISAGWESRLSRQEKSGKGGTEDERVKPFSEIQLVKVQPGQSRSGQARSESCLSPGDWWG